MTVMSIQESAWMPSPDDPWYPGAHELKRQRFLIVQAIQRATTEPKETIWWRICVLDRAFYECFECVDPDALAPYLKEVMEIALRYRGTDALHFARLLIKERYMALGIKEREW